MWWSEGKKDRTPKQVKVKEQVSNFKIKVYIRVGVQTDRLSYRLQTLRLTSEQENSGVICYPNVRTSSLLQICGLCGAFMENLQVLSAVQTHNAFSQRAASSRLSAGFKRVCRLWWTIFNFPQLIAIQT